MICGPPKFNSADTVLFFNFSHWIKFKFNFIFLLKSTIMRKKSSRNTLLYHVLSPSILVNNELTCVLLTYHLHFIYYTKYLQRKWLSQQFYNSQVVLRVEKKHSTNKAIYVIGPQNANDGRGNSKSKEYYLRVFINIYYIATPASQEQVVGLQTWEFPGEI